MPSKLPGYLLRAPDETMTRWKAAAAASGQTFSEYVRSSIESNTSSLVQSGQLPEWLATNAAAQVDETTKIE